MKTRDQLYGNEATELLRIITTYHHIFQSQILKLYAGKESKIENLLSHFVKQGRIIYDSEKAIYQDSKDAAADKEMLAAIWVLTDLAERIEYHSSGDFPTKLIFMADGELYDVICISHNKEAATEYALSQQESSEKRIIIVDSPEQISELNIDNVIAFCTVDIYNGNIQYYKQE